MTKPKLKLFCSKCGAKAQATCACGVSYIPAGIAAAIAVAAHPAKSNRAIAAETGIPEISIRRARNSTASNDAVDKRIGLDGKTRRLPTTPDRPTPSELKHVPAAVELAERVASYLRELKREASYHGVDTSPRRVSQLMYALLTEIFAGISSPAAKAKVCEVCASEWKIDETKLNEDVINNVRKTAKAWSDLHERLEAAADSCGVADGPGPADEVEAISSVTHSGLTR